MDESQIAVPCSVIRGGTSRAVYFLAADLPKEQAARDRVLAAVMGGPDALQIDGLGGGHPLSSKVAIVGPASRDGADVDYLFLQVTPDTQKVSNAQNCGNILSGVAGFAIDGGLVKADDDETVVRVHMVNGGNLCELTVATPGGAVEYAGDVSIDGVPGSGSPVVCDFMDVAGSTTGALLPTGNVMDEVDGVQVTCIDNGMPIVIVRAADFGISGQEEPQLLDDDGVLKQQLEAIRLAVGPKMNLGDVRNKTVPKMCLVSPPTRDGSIATRTFIPHVCHRSIGVLGAVSVATACLLPGSVANDVAVVPDGDEKVLPVEHPTGSFDVRLLVDESADTDQLVKRAGVVRTARLIMRGSVFIAKELV